MRGEILSIGTEILLGEIVDTNAPYIASWLPSFGINIERIVQVGDDIDDLVEALKESWNRSEIVFTTGGLGPTEDDLTREAISLVLGEEMMVDDTVLKNLEQKFLSRGVRMPSQNIKQANMIPSSHEIPNKKGTAPGWWISQENKIIVALPGPPVEMRDMWNNWVKPKLSDSPLSQTIIVRTIKTIGLSEAEIDGKIMGLKRSKDISLGIYAKRDGVHLRIVGKGLTKNLVEEGILDLESRINSVLFSYIWGYDEETAESSAMEALSQKKLSVATMESCTGGLLANTITDVPGSSIHFLGGVVSYSDQSKIAYGVPGETLNRYGSISPEAAMAMANAIRIESGADIGVGITGVAGPSTQGDKKVGEVFVAISSFDTSKSLSLSLPPHRIIVKQQAVAAALIELRKFVDEV